MQLVNKTAVVTGASSGIGRAISLELGLAGVQVVLASRSKEQLEKTSLLLKGYGIGHTIIVFDITSETSIDNLIQLTLDRFHSLDIFVNNAGIGLFEGVLKSNLVEAETLFETNFWGPLKAMQKIARQSLECTFVNISSAASKYAPYNQGIYAASKAALERITEAIGLEEKKIKTLLVVADRTDTPFMKNALGPKENARLAFKLRSASPEQVAQKITHALKKDARVCYTTPKSRLYSTLAISPGLMQRILKKALP